MIDSIRHPIVVPDLQLDGVGLVALTWLVAKGGEVHEGDRVLEVLAGDVLYDISAPVTGRLASRNVREEQAISAGQVVGYIASGG